MRLWTAVASSIVVLIVSVSSVQTTPNAQAPSASKVELGRLLFWDPILSGSKDVACATCHHPDFAYADGRDLSLGTGSVGLGPARASRSNGVIPVVKRNSPTVLNTAFNGLEERRRRGGSDGVVTARPENAPMLWDIRVRSLETQALEPLKSLEEMRGTTYPENDAVATVVARLNAVPGYVSLFRQAFGTDGAVDAQQMAEAIAAFERTLVAMNSPFDRYRGGDTQALTPQQVRGMQAFDDVGCDRCHDGPMFSDFDLRAEGVREHPALAQADAGDGRFRFRTPSLRNIELTAPYMHNGTLATLDEVLRFYDEGRSQNPNVSDRRGRRDDAETGPRVDRRFQAVDDMSEEQRDDIVAFMRALTDREFDRMIPARVPSGLPPGGLIQSR